MSTKSELLKLLESHRGEYLSGEELALRLGYSRTAVWKAMKSLRQEGYRITAVNNRGYALETDKMCIRDRCGTVHCKNAEKAQRRPVSQQAAGGHVFWLLCQPICGGEEPVCLDMFR